MKPSYWLAGLSSLGVLIALLLTVVNVSVAQEDKAQLWVTVIGDVTFNEDYSDITDMAPDASLVIEERNGLENRKVVIKVIKSEGEEIKFISGEGSEVITGADGTKITNGRIVVNGNTTLVDDTIVVKIEENSLIATGYNYAVNSTKLKFDDNAMAWYEEALESSLPHFYPRASFKDQMNSFADQYEDKVNGRTIYFIAEPNVFENTFYNFSQISWEKEPSKEELLSAYRDDVRYQIQRYSAGLLSDRSFAGYLDGLTASPDFPVELFADAASSTNELKDKTLKQQLVNLMDARSKIPKEEPLIFIQAESSMDEPSGTITAKPSPDGKNRVYGEVTFNGQPAPFGNVVISEADSDVIIGSTGTNKEGEFSFSGFGLPSGDYIIWSEYDRFFPGKFLPFTINEQELEITLQVGETFDTLEPKLGAAVSVTPTLSWEAVPQAVRYTVVIHAAHTREQFVEQMTAATSMTLELPLLSKGEYFWSVLAHDKNGGLITIADGDIFKTE